MYFHWTFFYLLLVRSDCREYVIYILFAYQISKLFIIEKKINLNNIFHINFEFENYVTITKVNITKETDIVRHKIWLFNVSQPLYMKDLNLSPCLFNHY